MTTKAELDAARQAWSEARRLAVYEHRALDLLMLTRKDAMKGYTDSGRVEDSALLKGTELYRKHLAQHVERVRAALEHLDKVAKDFAAIRAQYAKEGKASRTPAIPSADYVGWRRV